MEGYLTEFGMINLLKDTVLFIPIMVFLQEP